MTELLIKSKWFSGQIYFVQKDNMLITTTGVIIEIQNIPYIWYFRKITLDIDNNIAELEGYNIKAKCNMEHVKSYYKDVTHHVIINYNNKI